MGKARPGLLVGQQPAAQWPCTAGPLLVWVRSAIVLMGQNQLRDGSASLCAGLGARVRRLCARVLKNQARVRNLARVRVLRAGIPRGPSPPVAPLKRPPPSCHDAGPWHPDLVLCRHTQQALAGAPWQVAAQQAGRPSWLVSRRAVQQPHSPGWQVLQAQHMAQDVAQGVVASVLQLARCSWRDGRRMVAPGLQQLAASAGQGGRGRGRGLLLCTAGVGCGVWCLWCSPGVPVICRQQAAGSSGPWAAVAMRCQAAQAHPGVRVALPPAWPGPGQHSVQHWGRVLSARSWVVLPSPVSVLQAARWGWVSAGRAAGGAAPCGPLCLRTGCAPLPACSAAALTCSALLGGRARAVGGACV